MGSTPCQGSPVFPWWAAACNETCPPHSVPPPGKGQGLPLLRGYQYPRFPSSQHHCHRQGNGGWPREKGISMPPPHTRATSTPGNIELSNVPLTLAPQLHPGSCLGGGQGIGKGQAPPNPTHRGWGSPSMAEVRMGLCPCARAGCPPPARGPGTPEPLRAPTPSSASGSGGICPGWQAQLSPSQVHSGRCRSLPPPPSWGHRLWLRGATGQGLPLLQPGTPRLTPALSEHPEPSLPPAAGYTQGVTPPPGEGQSRSPNLSRCHLPPPPP